MNLTTRILDATNYYLLFVFLLLSCIGSKGKNEYPYIFSFGCCFGNDSVIVKQGSKIYFSGRVNTDENTSKDNKNGFLISQFSNPDAIVIALPEKRKEVKLYLNSHDSMKFVEIIFYRDSLYYHRKVNFLE